MTNQPFNQMQLSADNQAADNSTDTPKAICQPHPSPRRGDGGVTDRWGRQSDDQQKRAAMTNTPPSLDDLTELKQRLNSGVAWCQARAGTPKARTGYDRLMRIMAREYLPGIHAVREQRSREDLVQARDTVLKRLERGWDTDPAPEDDENTNNRAELFSQLLTQYEVFEDILTDDSVIAQTMDRVSYGA